MNFSNIEIEQTLIGRMLNSDDDVLAAMTEEYTEDDFSEAMHWQLYREIRSGKRVRHYALEKAEIFDYVRALADANIPLIGGNDYHKILRELGIKRKVRSALMDCLDSLDSMGSAEILGFLNSTIHSNIETSKLRTRKEIRDDIVTGLALPPSCYATPFKVLNNCMAGGFYEGYTYGFCGAEKAGKTTLAHSISNRIDCKHLYIAMEMGAAQIEQKNIAADLNINSLRFLDRPDGLKERIETAHAAENLIYYDAPGATLNDIVDNVRLAKIKYKIRGFIIDYWQLVGGQQHGESEEKHLRNVAQSLANLARQEKLWCLILAQMNKDGQLFGGNGLRKACDQLYMIESCGEYYETGRWLRMDASRYTFKTDAGSEHCPAIALNMKSGPVFHEL